MARKPRKKKIVQNHLKSKEEPAGHNFDPERKADAPDGAAEVIKKIEGMLDMPKIGRPKRAKKARNPNMIIELSPEDYNNLMEDLSALRNTYGKAYSRVGGNDDQQEHIRRAYGRTGTLMSTITRIVKRSE